MKTYGKVTIYYRSEFFGWVKKEVRELEVRIGRYAQYPSALHVEFKVPRARNSRLFVQSYSPSLVIVGGWGHPEPSSAWTEARDLDGVTVRESKYLSCDPRYDSDFDAFLAATNLPVIADYRKHDSMVSPGTISVAS